jgi:hypothetical protein
MESAAKCEVSRKYPTSTRQQLFNPQFSFVVGDGGIGVEDFLSMDMKKLF